MQHNHSGDIRDDLRRLEQLTPVIKSLSGNTEALLESLPLPAFMKNPVGELSYMNQAYARIYNVDRTDYIGRRDSAVWNEDAAREFARTDKRVAMTGDWVLANERLEEGRTVTVLKFAVYDGPKYLGVAGVVLADDGATGIPRIAADCHSVPAATDRDS